ncbi:phage GP46 family protein [Aeromonas piscicola]|uniref:phage GP46 family protein n=1 Tax=Aeromonas piscicola TaxID=600645 RepID=UPI0005B4A193|nr:phage GP46 family protein [Aeromonas piscicola]
MRDAGITWKNGRGCLVLTGGDLLNDDSVNTALIISYFTDRRAQPGDTIPDGSNDARGYWGDAYRASPMGSRLWLLAREKQLQSALEKAVRYAKEATDWMKDDGLVSAIKITANSPREGELRLITDVTLPDGSALPAIEFIATGLGV